MKLRCSLLLIKKEAKLLILSETLRYIQSNHINLHNYNCNSYLQHYFELLLEHLKIYCINGFETTFHHIHNKIDVYICMSYGYILNFFILQTCNSNIVYNEGYFGRNLFSFRHKDLNVFKNNIWDRIILSIYHIWLVDFKQF